MGFSEDMDNAQVIYVYSSYWKYLDFHWNHLSLFENRIFLALSLIN